LGTTGGSAALIGNQVIVPVGIPASVCADAAALLGVARAGCQGGVAVAAGMTSNSLAALVIGALLAGASAVKIASRRLRDARLEAE
jgi:hypothetical protein